MTDEIIFKYFTELNEEQQQQIVGLGKLYGDWNEKINLISRKDMEHFYERHVLHSLGIAKVCKFKPQTQVLDVGTGGGFPGVPLAILFPETQFHLIDSIGKKIMVVNDVVSTLKLKNITTQHIRAEAVVGKYDFVLSRAVTQMSPFYLWVRNKIKPGRQGHLKNGIISLKGGDLTKEMKALKKPFKIFELKNYFEEEFFETKKVVHCPIA